MVKKNEPCNLLGRDKQEFWYKYVTQQQSSSLSQMRYCEANKLCYTTFCYWRSKLLKKSKKQPADPSAPVFKQVTSTSMLGSPPAPAMPETKITVIFPNKTLLQIPANLATLEFKNIFCALGALL